MSPTFKILSRTALGRENSTGFYMQGRQSLLTFLTVTRWSRSTANLFPRALFPGFGRGPHLQSQGKAPWGRGWLYVQFLCSDWSTGEFMRTISSASGNLLTDSCSWQSFVSSCDILNCLFLFDVPNEIQLLSRLFCNSWLGFLLRFLLTNAALVKFIGNPISDDIVFKNELTHLPLLEA